VCSLAMSRQSRVRDNRLILHSVYCISIRKGVTQKKVSVKLLAIDARKVLPQLCGLE
jgi:hypothetical protein